MEPTTIILLIGIAIFSLFEYQRRERLHKAAMEYLKRGVLPPAAPTRPSVWKLRTVGVVDLLLLPVTGLFMKLALHGDKYLWAYLFLVVCFAALFVLLLLILMRDIRVYQKG